MNQKETAAIMAVVKVAYPRYYQNITIDETLQTVKLWQSMLLDYPYDVVSKAVKALIATEKFVPTIADVIEKIQLITTKQAIGEVEAWALVKKAVRNGTYHSKNEFEKLPTEIQTVLGSHNTLKEWAMMESEDSIETVIASNFMRSYRAKKAQFKELNALPNDVKSFMSVLAEKMEFDRLTGTPKKEVIQIQTAEKPKQERSGVPEEFLVALEKLRTEIGIE